MFVMDQRCHHSMQFCVCFLTILILGGANSFSLSPKSLLNAYNKDRSLRQTTFRKLAEGANGRANNATKPLNRLLVFGLGNVGTLVAQRSTSFKRSDNQNKSAPFFGDVYGTTRSVKEIAGVQAIHFDSYQELEDIIPSCTHVLITIPPVNPPSSIDSKSNATTLVGGRPRCWKFFCDPVLNHPNFHLQDLVPANTWVGYVSSTSVYGNHDGGWVTEDSEVKCKPGTKGKLYFRAENEWREAAQECGWNLNIFRSSGLYGDGRSAIHTIRKRGAALGLSNDRNTAPEKNRPKAEAPTSRIHEEDVSQAILSAMARKKLASPCCLWNLADNYPAPRAEVMAFGTEILREENLLPPMVGGQSSKKKKQSERARRRLTDRKRVANQRMKDLLLPEGKLIYPTYREGLWSVLNSNREEWSSDAASE